MTGTELFSLCVFIIIVALALLPVDSTKAWIKAVKAGIKARYNKTQRRERGFPMNDLKGIFSKIFSIILTLFFLLGVWEVIPHFFGFSAYTAKIAITGWVMSALYLACIVFEENCTNKMKKAVREISNVLIQVQATKDTEKKLKELLEEHLKEFDEDFREKIISDILPKYAVKNRKPFI